MIGHTIYALFLFLVVVAPVLVLQASAQVGHTLSTLGGQTVLSGDTFLGPLTATDFIGPNGTIKPYRCATETVSGALTLGNSNVGTCTAAGAVVGMVVNCTPNPDPGAGVDWSRARVSAPNTVTVQECATTDTVTPTPTVFQCRVFK